MRRLVPLSAAFVLVVAMPGLGSLAFAHGGRYVAPPGEVPPDSREPTDPPPPPEGGPPSSPSGDPSGGPSTPSGGPTGGPQTPDGGGGRGPGSGGGPGPGGGAGPTGGPTTRGGGPRRQAGYSSWVVWWGHNKEEILQLKSALKQMQSGGSTGGGFGVTPRGGVRSVTEAEILGTVVPALRKFLRDEDESFHVRSAAQLGLAKIGDAEIAPLLRRMAVNEGKALHREIEETAALALGLLQRDDAETRALLLEVVRNQAKDGTYVRPFSAISLGLLGAKDDRDAAVAATLLEVIARKEPGQDVKPACFTGLGLLAAESTIAPLAAMVRDGKAPSPGAVALSEVEQAYAVAALGKIGRPGTSRPGEETIALDEVLRVVDERSRRGTNVRRSAAIALGQIGPQCPAKTQRKVVAALAELLDPNGEDQERNFAVMSLARVAAAPGVDAALRKDVVEVLSRTVQKGRGQTPAFAAMALGLVARATLDGGGGALEEEVRAPLRDRFDGGGDPQIRGAFALASGLARDPLAVRSLLESLKDTSEDRRVRGWCALALGLMQETGATDAVRTVLREETDRDLRTQAAIAAGLMNHPGVIDDLVKVITDRESSNFELGSAASALAQIGDERAIAPLVAIAVDAQDRYAALTRSLAVVALGQIGDRRDLPTLARLATDLNYRAHVPAISELITIL